MVLGEFDFSGRRRPRTSSEPEHLVPADLVITAVGQSLEPLVAPSGLELAHTRSGFYAADPGTGQTSVPWIFTAGDAATGPASVVEAVAGGERAAVGIDRLLTGAEHAFWRPVLPLLAVEPRWRSFAEIEQSFGRAEATREAGRCLRCDYKETCPSGGAA